MAIPEDVAGGDPSHDVHHNQLHDLYNYVDGLADGRVIVGAATPGVGTDLNLTTEPWISDADDISDTSTTNKFTTAAEISKLAGIEAGATADQTGAQIKTAYEAESDTNAFDDAAAAKLAAIEALADVTDATNVDAAGAVMTSDASTAGMGFVVDEDTMVSNSSTKVPTQQSVKQYVDDSVSAAGGGDMLSTQNLADLQNAMTSRQNLGVAIGTDVQAYNSVLDSTTASYTTADQTKLNGIEALADVTDTANVTAAGALMDSEVDADIKTLSLPASTTISTFGATLIDDADAAAARTTLGVTADTANDGAYDAITHSASGAVALNFNDSDVGFKVTASANITDITFSNGPTSGNQKRRTVEVVATATITVAFGTLDVVESGIPTSMVNGDKFMADLVVTA